MLLDILPSAGEACGHEHGDGTAMAFGRQRREESERGGGEWMGTPGGLERGSRSRGVAALSSRGVHRRRGGSGGDQPPVATGSGEQRPDRGGGVGRLGWVDGQLGRGPAGGEVFSFCLFYFPLVIFLYFFSVTFSFTFILDL